MDWKRKFWGVYFPGFSNHPVRSVQEGENRPRKGGGHARQLRNNAAVACLRLGQYCAGVQAENACAHVRNAGHVLIGQN